MPDLRKLVTGKSSVLGTVEFFGGFAKYKVSSVDDLKPTIVLDGLPDSTLILLDLGRLSGVYEIGSGGTIDLGREHSLKKGDYIGGRVLESWEVMAIASLPMAKNLRIRSLRGKERIDISRAARTRDAQLQALSLKAQACWEASGMEALYPPEKVELDKFFQYSETETEAIAAAIDPELKAIIRDFELLRLRKGLDALPKLKTEAPEDIKAIAALRSFYARISKGVPLELQEAVAESESKALRDMLYDMVGGGDIADVPFDEHNKAFIKEVRKKGAEMPELDISPIDRFQELQAECERLAEEDLAKIQELDMEATEIVLGMPEGCLREIAQVTMAIRDAVLELCQDVEAIAAKAREVAAAEEKPVGEEPIEVEATEVQEELEVPELKELAPSRRKTSSKTSDF